MFTPVLVSPAACSWSISLSILVLQVLLSHKVGCGWKQMTVPKPAHSATMQRLVLAERTGGSEAEWWGQAAPWSCCSLGSMRRALWHDIILRHFESHAQSQKNLLRPRKAYVLQLHFVKFNRKTHVAFWNFGVGVYPASSLYLNKTSAQPAHTPTLVWIWNN